MKTVELRTVWTLAILALSSFALHIVPFYLYGPHPLGYDTGFYRRYLIQPFLSFPNLPVPGLGSDAVVPRLMLDTLRLINTPTDLSLYGSYLICFSLLPLLLFLLLRRYLGQRGALIAGLLIILSAVSYNTYSFMLWKNAFALDLILLSFILIDRRMMNILFVVDLAIALSHETSAIIYMSTLGIYFLLEKGMRRNIAFHILLTLAAFLAVNLSLIHQVTLALPSAIFLDWKGYLTLSLPFLLVILFGSSAFRSMKMPRILVAFGIASFMFPILHLPFYERIFAFCDIVLVTLAAYATEYLVAHIDIRELSGRMYLYAAVLCVSIGLFFGNLWNQIDVLRPLVSPQDIQMIGDINAQLPDNVYLLTTSDEAPWYEGWTRAHVVAPGLLHDTHDLKEWESFWSATSTQQKISFMSSFPKPLYMSTLGLPSDLIGGLGLSCLKEVSPHLFFNDCSITDPSLSSSKLASSTLLATEVLPLDIKAGGVYDLKDGAVWEWNAKKQLPLASLTKIMTAVIADQLIAPKQVIEMTKEAEAPLVQYQAAPTFMVGDALTQQDLIRSMFTVSSNDAAEALAVHYGRDRFIKAMNNEAKKLGMDDTVFVSASGLSPDNVSTVADLSRLVRFVWNNDREILTPSRSVESSVTVTNNGAVKKISLTNIDPFASDPTFLGGKTGELPGSGGDLVSVFYISGGPKLTIVLGTNDRFGETKKILNGLY